LLVVSVSLYGYSTLQKAREDNDTIYQVATIHALLNGVYDGDTTFKELHEHGDIGLGTFNGLDGEMVDVDGVFYQVKADGRVYPVNNSMRTPFAVVTFFEADETVVITEHMNYTQLERYLDEIVPTDNIFYAIKIEDTFNYLMARSVPRQSEPYPLLVDAVKNQSLFDFYSIEGTIVGFRTPSYMEGVNVPGYHFHFIRMLREDPMR